MSNYQGRDRNPELWGLDPTGTISSNTQEVDSELMSDRRLSGSHSVDTSAFDSEYTRTGTRSSFSFDPNDPRLKPDDIDDLFSQVKKSLTDSSE